MGKKLSDFWEKFGYSFDNSFVKEAWGSKVKAVAGSLALVMFGVSILVISLFAVANPTRVQPHGSEAVAYYLPYPGILPDNPLYKLKMVRDRVKLWLTFEPEAKARRQLFYADKRINAAEVLVNGGKGDLAITVASKAEKYLEQAIGGAMRMTREGKDVKSLLLTLEKATAKHAEILGAMGQRAEEEGRVMLEEMAATTQGWHTEVEQTLNN